MRTRLFVGFAAMLTCAALRVWAQAAAPQAQDTNKTYTLRLTSSIGEVLTVKTTNIARLETTGEQGEVPVPFGADAIMSSTNKYKTVAIKPDGTIIQRVENMGYSLMRLGQETKVPKSPPTTQETDKYGRTKAESPPVGEPGSHLRKFMGNITASYKEFTSSAVFPDHPVKVGDSWTTDMHLSAGSEEKITSTLISAEILNGKSVLKIKQISTSKHDVSLTMDGTPAKEHADGNMRMKGEITSEGVVTVLEENGQTLSSQSAYKSETTMTLDSETAARSPYGNKLTLKMSGTTSMELLSGAKAPDKKKPVHQRVKEHSEDDWKD